MLLGVAVCGSLASYLLLLPVLASSLFIWTGSSQKKNIYLIGIVASLVAVFIFDMFISGNLQQELLDKFTSLDSSRRHLLFENSYEISKTFLPVGTGPGSFADVYRLIEEATLKTIPHAHNDYIEMFAEFGIIGLVWMFLALLWIAKNIVKAFLTKTNTGRIAQYMSVSLSLIHI